MTIAPASERLCACSRLIADSGVSRTHRISLRRSLSATCAVRLNRVSPRPQAIFAIVEIEHGRMTRASNEFEPEENGAARSSSENVRFTCSARWCSVRPVSSFNTYRPHLVRIRYFSASQRRKKSTPNMAPEAPVIPITTRMAEPPLAHSNQVDSGLEPVSYIPAAALGPAARPARRPPPPPPPHATPPPSPPHPGHHRPRPVFIFPRGRSGPSGEARQARPPPRPAKN